MEEITYGSYWQEIRRITKELFDNILLHEDIVEGRDTFEQVKNNIDAAFHDHIVTYVDGHSWVIHTYQNIRVMLYTENRNGLFDQGLDLSNADTFEDASTNLAYWAMYSDIMDYYYENADAWIEEILKEEYEASNAEEGEPFPD
jgi:hypothetical protein